MYTETDFKTKKELKLAFQAGKDLYVYQPGGMFEGKTDGRVTVEGPHYPHPHTWYASVEIQDSKIVRIYG